MKTYIAQTDRLKNQLAQYDNALQLLGGAFKLENAQEKANELAAKGYTITKIEEEDGEFFIYGREKNLKLSAFAYSENTETEGYTLFTGRKLGADEKDGGEDSEYIIFDRNTIIIL